jgi:tetratricopeptide (TPR) repeat protein
MMKKVLFVVGLLVASNNLLLAQKVFDFNSTCQQAYTEITKLKFATGQTLIAKAKQENANNLIPLVLENYIDVITLFFTEDAAVYAQKKPIIEQRIVALQEGPTNSAYYKFCLSTLYLQKALVEIKFVENWRASWDVRKAFSLIKENKKAYPNFIPNDVLYGSLQTALATIPSGYSFFTSILGLNGSVEEGMKLLKNVLNSNDPLAKIFQNETSFFYCYLLFHVENKKNDVWPFIQQRKLDLVNNHTLAFMAANLMLNNKQLKLTENIIVNRNKSADYFTLPIWEYEMAFVKLYHLETVEAAKYFESYLQKFKGNFYTKDAYLKLSWCYYLQGNMAAAEAARKNVLLKGSTDTDADKQAVKEAKTGIWPNVLLLKARMLSDGGYYNEALAVLHGKNIHSFTKEEEQLEFVYRVARIYDDLKRDAEAIQFYSQAIQLGSTRREYYAARSALQLGEIYERQQNKTKAITYFEQCLAMKDHEYKNSLDQKAKAGIARCGAN